MTALLSRRPQQARSRASFDRVLAAARDLLARNGYDGFTLMEVSQQAQVSIGAIYGRVAGKDDLIRHVHAAVMADIQVERRRSSGRIIRSIRPGRPADWLPVGVWRYPAPSWSLPPPSYAARQQRPPYR